MSFSRVGGVPTPEPERRGAGWDAVTLRGACLSLLGTTANGITRISVTGPRPVGPDAERWLRHLVQRLGDEYALETRVEARDPGMTIVFTRPGSGA
ncbi:MAG TPA: hypothetical protein VMU89_20740 [Thermomicrobiaceae bacterium]|nr:hypothetical protein [Thermomicrobiaceae bacterium]